MAEIYLRTKNLTKEFRPGIGAKDINIEIKAGEIVGFIGPNGAGKTTTIKMILGLIAADSGELEVFGELIDHKVEFSKDLHQVGYQPSEGGVYENITARQLFAYTAKLHQNPKAVLARAVELSAKLSLDTGVKVNKLSFGNKKKVSLVLALMHDPKLVILDEPTAGLDPVVQNQVAEILLEMQERGHAVFLSSHVLSEVQSICDRVIFIKNSQIILNDTIEHALDISVSVVKIIGGSDSLKKKIKTLNAVSEVKEFDGTLMAYTSDKLAVVKVLIEEDHENFFIEQPSLEVMFLNLYK